MLDLMTDTVALYNHLGYVRAPDFDVVLDRGLRTKGGRPVASVAFRRSVSPVVASGS